MPVRTSGRSMRSRRTAWKTVSAAKQSAQGLGPASATWTTSWAPRRSISSISTSPAQLIPAVATTTKRDFSFLGSFLMVGVIVVMLGVVANIFLASPVLHLVLCGAFVILSSMLILWQLNAIVNGGETNYVSATLTLYISIYNLFTSLLQLLMAFAGERE